MTDDATRSYFERNISSGIPAEEIVLAELREVHFINLFIANENEIIRSGLTLAMTCSLDVLGHLR